MKDVARGTKVPEEAIATIAPWGAPRVNPGPTSVVRPAGIVTVIGGGFDTGPPPSIRESRTSTGAVPGLAKDTAHLPLGAAVPACITHAAAGWAPKKQNAMTPRQKRQKSRTRNGSDPPAHAAA